MRGTTLGFNRLRHGDARPGVEDCEVKIPRGVYVDAPNDAIASALMAAHLKIASSTTSDVMVKMLMMSNKMPGVVAGKSDMVTAATIRRAIEDAGPSLPANGQLVIVGEPKDFEETANFAKSRGLNVDVMSPVQKDGNPPHR